MLLGMFRWFGIIEPKLGPLKSLVMVLVCWTTAVSKTSLKIKAGWPPPHLNKGKQHQYQFIGFTQTQFVF